MGSISKPECGDHGGGFPLPLRAGSQLKPCHAMAQLNGIMSPFSYALKDRIFENLL